MPSIADTSGGSSQEDDEFAQFRDDSRREPSSLARALFPGSENDEPQPNTSGSNDRIRLLYATPPHKESKSPQQQSSSMDTWSVTSSPSFVRKFVSPPYSSPLTTPDNSSREKGRLDDVPIESSCPGGLNLSPKQLGDLFSLFEETRREWPAAFRSAADTSPANMSDTSTAVTGNLSTEAHTTGLETSLQQENETLKEVISFDSRSLMKLKSEVGSLQDISARQLQTIKDLQNQLDTVGRERDTFKDRDSVHQDTINILKEEVDSLTQRGARPSPEILNEMEQLKIENELFASQIIENEAEMKEMRSLLEFMDKENEQLRQDLEALQKAAREKAAESGDIAFQLKMLARRISDIERDQDIVRQSQEHDAQMRREELMSIKQMITGDRESFDRRDGRILECGGEGFEVALRGTRPSKEKESCCWSTCCDYCFLAHREE